jgi:hypothetical protein
MENQILILVLTNSISLITKVEEVSSELGEPDCRLIKPYLIDSELNITPWLNEMTNLDEFMISSDKILTLIEPKKSLLDKYLELTQ